MHVLLAVPALPQTPPGAAQRVFGVTTLAFGGGTSRLNCPVGTRKFTGGNRKSPGQEKLGSGTVPPPPFYQHPSAGLRNSKPRVRGKENWGKGIAKKRVGQYEL